MLTFENILCLVRFFLSLHASFTLARAVIDVKTVTNDLDSWKKIIRTHVDITSIQLQYIL